MSAQSGSGSTKATTGMTLSGNSPKVPWLPPVPPPVEQYDGGSSGMKNTTTNNKNSHNIGDATATRIQLPEPGIAGMPYAPIRRQISNISQNSGGILSPKNMDGEYQEGSGNPSLNNNSNMGMMMMMMPPLPPPPPAWQQQQQQQQQQHPEELLSARYQEEHHHQQQPTDAVVAPELEQTWDAGVEALEGGGGEEGQIYASNNGDQPYYQQQQEYYRQDTYAYQYGQQQQGEGGGMKADGGGGDTDMPSLPHGPSCTGDVPSYDNDTANTANLKLPPPPGAENSPIKAKFARSLRKGMLISAHSGVLPRVTTDDNNNSAPTDENHHHHHHQQQQHVGDENENANSARHHQQDEYAYRDNNNNNISMDDEHQHQQHQQQPGSSDFGAPPTLPPVTTLLKQECPPLGGQPGSGQGGRPVGPFMRPNSSRSNGDGGGDGGNRNAVTSPTFMPLATVGGSDSARSGQQQQAPPSFLQRPGSGGALDGNGSSSGSLHPPLPSQPPSASSQQQQQQPYKFQQQQPPLTTTNNQLQRIKQLKKTKKRSFIRRLLPWLLLLMVVSAIIGAAGVVVCITAVANVIDSMGSVATKVRWNHIPGEVGALIIAINYNNNNNNNGIIITDPPPPPPQQQQQPQLVWPYPAEESVLIGLHSPAQQLGKVLSVQNEVAQQRAAAILSCSASSNGLPGLGDDGDYDDDLAGMGRDDYGDQEMKEMMASRRKRRQAAALLKKKESAGGRSSVCLWAQWSIKQTLLSVQLSKQAASMALYHGPSVIVTYSKSAAAFLGRHYLELQRQMFGLKSSHGRAEVYAHITGRLGEARQLIKDLMHWSHCLAQHFKVSGMGSWDAIAQPAAGCWQEHLGRYYITGSTNNTGDDVTRSSNNTGDGVVAGQAEGDVEQGEDIAPAYVVGSHVDTGGEHVVDEQPQVVEMDEQKEEIQPLQEQQQQQENSGEEAVEKPPAEVEDNTQPPIDDVLQQEKEIAVADGTDVVEESIQEKEIDIAVAVGTDVVEESIEGDAGEEQQQWEEKAHTPVEGRTQLDPHPVAPAPAPEPHSHASTDSHVGSEVKDVDAYYAEMVAQYEEEQKQQQQQQQQQGEGQQQQQHQEEVEEVGKEEDKGEMVVTDIPASPAPVEVVVQLQNGDSLRESLGLTAPVPKPPVDDGSPPERRRKLGDPLTVVEPPSSPQQQHEQHAPPFAPTVEVPPLSPSVVEKTEAAITNAVATISGPLGALAMLVRDKSTEGLVGVKKSGLHAAELLSDVAAQAASSAKTAAGAVGSFLSGSLGSAVVGAALSAGGFMLKSWVDRRANGGVSVVGSPSVVLKAAMGRAKKAVTGNGGGSGSRTKRGDANKKDEAVGDVSDGDGEDEEVRVVAKKTTTTARRRKTSAADAIPVSPAKTPSRGRKSKSNVDVQDDNGGARPRSVSRRRRSTLSLRSS
jgi:hypothetical protein